MAYAIENAGRRRAQALVAVGLLHGVAIWAIASGFAGGVVNIVRDTLVAQQWREEVKITPIAPPEVKPSAKPVETRMVAPRSEITLAPVDPSIGVRPVEIGPILPVEIAPIGPVDRKSVV